MADWLKTEMLSISGGHQVVCVLHSTFLDMLLKSLLNLPVSLPDTGAGFFHTDNTSMSTVFMPGEWCRTGEGPGPTLLSLNSCPHIRPDGEP